MKCRTDCPDANETTARNNKACRNNLRGMTALLAKVQSEIQWNTHGAQGESIQVKPRLAGRMVIIILLSEQTDLHTSSACTEVRAFQRSPKPLTAEDAKRVAEIAEKRPRCLR